MPLLCSGCMQAVDVLNKLTTLHWFSKAFLLPEYWVLPPCELLPGHIQLLSVSVLVLSCCCHSGCWQVAACNCSSLLFCRQLCPKDQVNYVRQPSGNAAELAVRHTLSPQPSQTRNRSATHDIYTATQRVSPPNASPQCQKPNASPTHCLIRHTCPMLGLCTLLQRHWLSICTLQI